MDLTTTQEHISIMKRNVRNWAALFFLAVFFSLATSTAFAQFEVPEFEKLSIEESAKIMDNIKLTGRGLYEETKLEALQTNELRSRLQAAFGDPTKTLQDLINKKNFRPAKAIQFEYWFMVNDSIPMVVMDWDGPFGQGLTFGGASRYIDLMPQIKRTFADKLMSVESPANYQDYFYSPEREQWYSVAYKDGSYKTLEIDSPEGMSIDYSN
jgi:hypothetical protein